MTSLLQLWIIPVCVLTWNYSSCCANHACQVMVPLVLCFKTMWSVPDTVSWGADYESRTDSSMLISSQNSTDMDPSRVFSFSQASVKVGRWVD